MKKRLPNLSKKTLILIGITLVCVIFIFATKAERYLDSSTKFDSSYFPSRIDFAGEEVPLRIIDVQERLDRELLINKNLHASTLIILKKANRAFDIIEPILKKNRIPDDFKYLAVIESGLANVTSPAGARGIWQFMHATGKEMGLEINENIDERYHLEKSTEAACLYFQKAKERFGNWTLVAAAYNAGETGIQKQIDFQKVTNYYDLLLNEETSRYVFRILALKQIMKNPEQYGFSIQPNEHYKTIPTKKVTITTSVTNLADLAIEEGINYKLLKIYNPWLRTTKISNPTNKKYNLEIPLRGF